MNGLFYRPEQDSQFRLLPCACGNEDVGYQTCPSIHGAEYRVKCLNCGRKTPWYPCRHDAQWDWNRSYDGKKELR